MDAMTLQGGDTSCLGSFLQGFQEFWVGKGTETSSRTISEKRQGRERIIDGEVIVESGVRVSRAILLGPFHNLAEGGRFGAGNAEASDLEALVVFLHRHTMAGDVCEGVEHTEVGDGEFTSAGGGKENSG